MLSLLFLISAVTAYPSVKIRDSPITVPIAAHIKTMGSAHFVVQDRLRAQNLVKAAKAKAGHVSSSKHACDAVIEAPMVNTVIAYTANVSIGDPPTQYTLLVDTGSSNTWVGAGTPYIPTLNSTRKNNSVGVSYGDSAFQGQEYVDQVTLASGLAIQKQSIGVAVNSTGFDGVDGILGLGPAGLTNGTLSPDAATLIPTVADNLYDQRAVSSNQFAVSFEPTTPLSVPNGELAFGDLDRTKCISPIAYTPITNSSPSSDFWGIDQSIRYGTSKKILSYTAGIVDTGTTLILLATDAFETYRKTTGAVFDERTGLLRLTPTRFSKLKSLFFTIGDTTYELTANAQAWPRFLNSQIGGTNSSVYLIVGDLGTPSGEGFDFVNGLAFLQRFYTVHDTANRRIGLATTLWTHAVTN